MNIPDQPSAIAYIGPTGSSFGFMMAGIKTYACDSSAELLQLVRQSIQDKSHSIIFIDEAIAEPIYEDIEKLNQQPTPAFVLISKPGSSKELSKRKMDELIIKALGADIIN